MVGDKTMKGDEYIDGSGRVWIEDQHGYLMAEVCSMDALYAKVRKFNKHRHPRGYRLKRLIDWCKALVKR